MHLNGKVALVTGSTSGIGLGIACALAEAGAELILNGFGEVDRAKEKVARYGARPGYHDADLSDPAQIEAMMQYAERSMAAWIFWSIMPGSSMSLLSNSSRSKSGTLSWRSICRRSFTPAAWRYLE
jgi:NAD(P)-dependent dehydrogenase (short-subunit alcohol dehydrogenase family)